MFSDFQIVVFLWLERQVSDTVFFQLNQSLDKLEFTQRTLIQVFDFENNNVSGCGYDRTYDMTFIFKICYFSLLCILIKGKECGIKSNSKRGHKMWRNDSSSSYGAQSQQVWTFLFLHCSKTWMTIIWIFLFLQFFLKTWINMNVYNMNEHR